MAQENGDGIFSDGDLDELPAKALHELEQTAYLSTQQTKAPLRQRLQQSPVQDSRAMQDFRVTGKRGASEPNDVDTENYAVPPSSDYGLDDEEVIDLDDQSAVPAVRYTTSRQFPHPLDEVAQHEQWRQQRYTAAPLRLNQQPSGAYPMAGQPRHIHPRLYEGRSTIELESRNHARAQSAIPKTAQDEHPPFNVVELQARIQELEQERDHLRKSAEEAKDLAQSKSGEVAIVRANHVKTTRDYEQRMAMIQRTHAEEVEKARAELEATRQEREKMETDNRFLQHDQAQQAQRARHPKKWVENDAAHSVSPAATPRKSTAAPFGDGFDVDEVMVVSPTHISTRGKATASTPRAGLKRKRVVSTSNSPSEALSTTVRRDVRPRQIPESVSDRFPHGHVPGTSSLKRGDYMLEFMRVLHDHRPYHGHERTLEALTRHSLPSSPARSFYSMLYDSLSLYPAKDNDSFTVEFATSVLTIWSECMREKYYGPVYLLLDLLQLLFGITSSASVTSLTETVLPLVQQTVDLIAIPLAVSSDSLEKQAEPAQAPKEIDVNGVLSLLQTVLLACCTAPANDTANLTRFWKSLDYDFVLLMLGKAQPLAQTMIMLDVLNTSVLKDTFGAISRAEGQGFQEKQRQREAGLIERLTLLLFSMPLVPTGEETCEDDEIFDLRFQVLTTLRLLCATRHGGSLLAEHRDAIGRLVLFIFSTTERLYNYTPNESITPKLTNSINLATRVLAHLMKTYSDMIDIRQKLAVLHGGIHKHMIALSRLAFTEAVFYEKGLEEEVSELAHDMLDQFLSPEEGMAVTEVFGSAKE